MLDRLSYQKLACAALGLVHPDDVGEHWDTLLTLGQFQIIYNDAALDAVVERYLSRLRYRYDQVIHHMRSSGHYQDYRASEAALGELKSLAGKYGFLSFSDFKRYTGHSDAELNREDTLTEWRAGSEYIRYAARKRLAQQEHHGGSRAADRGGYRTYLYQNTTAELRSLLVDPIRAIVPDAPRREHTYCMATSGAGKSEFLKGLLLNYISDSAAPGVILIEPGGDMAEQVARWPELIPTGRLVYIDPYLDPDHVPVINPFDAPGLGEQERVVLSSEIVSALGTLIEGKVGGDLTVNMEAVLNPSVRLLVELPDTSIKDLLRLMRGDEYLVSLGRESSIPSVAEFFQHDFNLPTFSVTKQSIIVKISNILSRGTLEKVLCGPSTIDLERLINDQKVIVVNLDKGQLGDAESSALGTLLVSMVAAIAKRRSKIPEHLRPMTHLIIDECQNYLTSGIKTIIRETRKFRLALTLAQQELGGDMTPDLRRVVTKTTNVKIVGRSSREETRETAALVGADSEMVATAPKGVFFYSASNRPAVTIQGRTDRLGYTGGIDPAMWEQVKRQQLRYFYRRLGPAPSPTAIDTDSIDGQAEEVRSATAKEETRRARRGKLPKEEPKATPPSRYRFE